MLTFSDVPGRRWRYYGFDKPSWGEAPSWAKWLVRSRTMFWTWTELKPDCSSCFFLETREGRP